jgi:hypothetical protein
MSNTYRYSFTSTCPNNGEEITFSLEVLSEEMILVEDIIAAAAQHPVAYHEEIADELFDELGGKQILCAHHHGVDIETRRGFAVPSCGRLTQRVVVGTTVYEKGVEAIHAIKAISK